MTPIERLRHEFDAEDGTFLIQLRCNLRWDRNAFRRLVDAMEGYLQSERDPDIIPRWIACDFWHLDWFVRQWSSHENFPREHPQAYYEAAWQRLNALAFRLFLEDPAGPLPPFDAPPSPASPDAR